MMLHRALLVALGLFLGLIAPFLSFAQEKTSSFHIIGFGDSLMAGYRLDNNQSFPAMLERALTAKGYDVRLVNAGVSGDTTTTGLTRFDWSIGEKADLVILELGANDMLRGIDPDITRNNLDAMLERLRVRQIPTLLVGMLSAPNMGEKQGQIFNAIYPQLAEKYALPLYPFFLEGVISQPQYLLDDGMHPNAQGVARMVENFLPLMEQTLKSLGLAPQATSLNQTE